MFKKIILSVIAATFVSSFAMAQLTPGPGHGGGGSKPPTYNPCHVPTDPNCHGGGSGGGLTPGPGHGGYNPYEPTYPSDPYPDYSNNDVVKVVTLNRSVYNQSIDLRRLFNLDDRFTGYRVTALIADTTPNSPATTYADLVENGTVMAREVNPGQKIRLKPQATVRLNTVGTRLALNITGSTYIGTIKIKLSRY